MTDPDRFQQRFSVKVVSCQNAVLSRRRVQGLDNTENPLQQSPELSTSIQELVHLITLNTVYMFTMELILMHIFSKSLAVIEVAVEILLQIQVYFSMPSSKVCPKSK